MEYIHSIESKVQSLFLLKLTFWISFLGVLLSILLTYIFNRAVFFYNISYVLIIYLTVYAIIQNNKWQIDNTSINIYILLSYSAIITLPLTLINGHVIAFLVFFKNTILFTLLFFYYQRRLSNKISILYFMNIIVKSGVFFAIYLYIEFFNKILNIFPKFTQIISDYYQLSNQSAIALYADPKEFDIYSMIRPLGLEINFTSGAFFLSSVFFIVLISGHRFIKIKSLRILVMVLLYFSVFVTTSRQIIFSMHILLFFLFLIKIINQKIYDKILLKRIRIIFFCLITVVLIAYIYFNNLEHVTFITDAGDQTGSILSDDFNDLFQNIYSMISEYPLYTLFGIGGYTSTYPGLYNNLPSPNELHYLYDIPYSLGVIGGGIYWSIFVGSIRTSWLAFRVASNNVENFQDLYLVNVIIGLSLMFCLVHYSPTGLSTIFIISLIPLISIFAKKDIIKNKKIKEINSEHEI